MHTLAYRPHPVVPRPRSQPWRRLGPIALLRRLAALAARGRAAWRAARDERALHELDDRALRDLGLSRSEIASFAAELRGAAEPTRIRSLQACRDGFLR